MPDCITGRCVGARGGVSRCLCRRLQSTFNVVALALLRQRQPAREPWGPVLLDRDGRRSALGALLGDRLSLQNVAGFELLKVRTLAHQLLRRHDEDLVVALESAHNQAAWHANGGASFFAGGELASPSLWLPHWHRAMRRVVHDWSLAPAVLDPPEEAAA